MTIGRYAHLVGGARLGDRPETGVVDRTLRPAADVMVRRAGESS